MITDDRGRRVPLLPHETNARLRRDPERGRRLNEAPDGPREPYTRREIGGFILSGVIGVPLFFGVVIGPSFWLMSPRFGLLGPVLACLPMVFILGAAPVLIARLVVGRRVAREYVRAGYCGSCGYDIQAAPIAADGCRVCPECGAAWRV
jgi:hypothetical protein